MKIKFSKTTSYTPEWNENKSLPESEQVRVTLKPLKFDDLMSIMDGMGGAKMVDDVREKGIDAAKENIDMVKFVRSVGQILPSYACDVVNLEGDDGPITAEDMITYPSFLGLAVELLMQLTSISLPSESDEGNSEGQPG